MAESILLLGGTGLLGTPLRALLPAHGATVAAPSRSELDIGDATAIRRAIERVRPTVVVNCAAFTRVDDCEKEPERAMLLNGVGPGLLAQACLEVGVRLVHVSTDYVFDGNNPAGYAEDDKTGPDASLCAYGRSKLEGERRILSAGGAGLIVRTSWLFGPAGPNFVATIVAAARQRPELRVVNDQRGRPTYAPHLAAAIGELITRRATGIVHVANSGPCSWYEFAGEIVRSAGLTTPVRPCTTAEFPRPARRPACSILRTERFERLCGRAMPHWREGLAEYLPTL